MRKLTIEHAPRDKNIAASIGGHLLSYKGFALKEPVTPNSTNSHPIPSTLGRQASQTSQPSVASAGSPPMVQSDRGRSLLRMGFTAAYRRLIIQLIASHLFQANKQIASDFSTIFTCRHRYWATFNFRRPFALKFIVMAVRLTRPSTFTKWTSTLFLSVLFKTIKEFQRIQWILYSW